MTMSHRYSLIVPAYNEARLLPRLLDSIREAALHSGAIVQLIVADNASTDDTAEIARAAGADVVSVAKRCIAAARNAGAAVATGDTLCFVDADMQVHRNTFAAIDAALADPTVVGGATGVTMERWSVGIALTYASMLPMVWLTRLDTGVVFCRRVDFRSIGGYDETRLAAEDVLFLLALRRLGRARGQRLRRLRGVKAIASTRKFDEFGDWHHFTVLWHGMRHLVGRGDPAFASRYWYRPRR
jgi:glycosyltransferase involved in cell wall biosynthesis